MELRKVAETGTTITLGWTAPPDAQVYCFYANGVRVSTGTALYTSGSQKGKPREQVQFGKTGEPYEVAATCRDSAGVFRVELGVYRAAPPPPTGGIGESFLLWGWNGPPSAHVAEYDVVMFDGPPGNYAGLPAKKIANYFDVARVAGETDRRSPVKESFARSKGLLLHNTDGSEAFNARWQHYIGDFGDPVFQQEYLRVGIPFLKSEGFDGLFIDNVSRVAYGQYYQEYPTPVETQAAMLSFLNAVCKGLHDAGLFVVTNTNAYTGGDSRSNNGTLEKEWWGKVAALANHPDYLLLEYFQAHPEIGARFPYSIRKRGTDGWFKFWDEWQSWLAYAFTLPIQPMTLCSETKNRAEDLYTVASFYLEWDGVKGSAITIAGKDPWFAPPGKPTGPKRTNGNRVERPYERGLVWVDPVAGTASLP